MIRAVALAVAVALAACARAPARPVSPVRFANAEPVWFVDDRHDVPAPPRVRRDDGSLRLFDIYVYEKGVRELSLPRRTRALGINALGDVPTSTWFENRIGVRDVGLAELVRGPGDARPPDLSRPLRVVASKPVGAAPGFQAEDAAGVRWLIKLEGPGSLGQAATDIASQRLFWLAGYHVSENHAGWLTRDQVVLGDDATFTDALEHVRPMTERDLDAVFAAAHEFPDGRYRVLASKFLPGTPLGGFAQSGVRADDPNDTIPHERRRDLRGLYVFVAWLQHTDFKELGTVDVWQQDPRDPARHAVMHYLVDFGLSFGLFARGANRPDDGHTTVLDLDHVRSLFTYGLWVRPWEGTHDPGIPEVGMFDVAHFDPRGFTPVAPFAPFDAADARDLFWGTKILLRITPAHIRAALETGEFQDPRAVAYLQHVLIGRQRKLARYVFGRIAPLDAFAVANGMLCFTDLAVAHGLVDDGRRYAATSYDWDGRALGAADIGEGPDGRRCVARFRTGQARDAYTIVRVDVRNGTHDLPPVEVHLARGPGGAMRVIGVERW